ncbi:MAG: type II secretion system protein N [Rhodanobacteraceae bacterium]
MRVLKFFSALLLLLVAIAAVVAWTMPARLAWKLMAPRVPVLQLSDISGSMWDGRAAQASIAGQPLGALAWQTELLPLLHGDVRVHAHIKGADIEGHGEVTRHMDGLIVVRDAQVQLPGSVLQGALGLPSLRVQGRLHLSAREARIRNAWFVSLDGTGRWDDVGVSGAAEAHLGTINMRFSEPSPPTVHGEIRDDGHGPLTIHGALTALPTGYTLDARLRARDPNDLQTQEALRYLGQRQADGSVLLRAGGSLVLPSLP